MNSRCCWWDARWKRRGKSPTTWCVPSTTIASSGSDKIFNVGVSIGLVEIGRDSGTIEDIMNSADSACYVAKKQGGLHVHVYSAREEANARHSGEIHWLLKLQGALRDNKFELYYQPIVHARAGGMSGPALEVFVRLEGEHGQPAAPPAEFIRAAERYRLMPHVDRWVVQAVLAALGRGGLKLPPGRSVAINVAGQTLGDAEFLEFVVDCFDHTGANPGDICFEVTEASVVANLEHAQRFIGVLHGMGCEFALDNFGRGLSSFSTLKTLPMDYLKIDGSFIKNLAGDAVNQAMVGGHDRVVAQLEFPRGRGARRGSVGARYRDRHGHRFRAGLHGRPPAAFVDDTQHLKVFPRASYNRRAAFHNKLLWHFCRA